MVSKDQKRWNIAANIVMTIMTALAILPFILLIIASFTEENTALKYGYSYFPKAFSLDAYAYILQNASTFVRAYGMTIVVTALGTAASIVLTALTAYVLSKKGLPGGKILTLIVVFTMLFNGGLVATYISYVTIFHIKNTLFALVCPSLLMNAFSIMLVRNYFANSIPEEIYESARIDGASELTIFFKLVLPLSVPILATVGLMAGIAYWNDWQNALYYVDDKKLYTIQAILNSINDSISALTSLGGSAGVTVADLPSTTIRMAVAVVGILPVLVVYPFFQKYFAAGLMAGSVKG
ncbi:carbohydrate ABC transporter permease [Butyrivibrio sp. AC2005]|uniref:carbohydrate ABC transporter permease n=1 Tax=Butyrivibrio sp. AC2005 TaxID=1280672 RepID=UPI00040010C9|nr:carbohydrate ABC transporter permease [Butyrivibrio sp. AC2005]